MKIAPASAERCLRKRSTEPIDGQKHWHGPVDSRPARTCLPRGMGEQQTYSKETKS